eukprot:gnl/Hemi2/21347_TR7100_c0_g1_i1.p1 gnl/Hemi2/21347_TR7100_c0_g1~~gnl/Hemi2/21347_TR7100_c0_g1_i1.p1  ORF type:complete len:557 (-),score=194.83 gnl/Hemi2/21347_TR7100_c0_g1_i1:316-1986(-)
MIRHSGKQAAASRTATNPAGAAAARKAPQKLPTFEEMLEKRDFRGAHTILTISGDNTIESTAWKAYTLFHLSEFGKAKDLYGDVLTQTGDPNNHTYIAACLFHMQQYQAARQEAMKGPRTRLQTRLLFHIAAALRDDHTVQQLSADMNAADDEDQLSLAAYHYSARNYDLAASIYNRLLEQNPRNLALSIYLAMCLFRQQSPVQESDEPALQLLNLYLHDHADSITAQSIKAAIQHRLVDGAAAEAEIKGLLESPFATESDVVQHNLVVYRNGQNAIPVLGPLVELIPEARINLANFHLHNQDFQQAYALIKDLKPVDIQERLTVACVLASYGQQVRNADMLHKAEEQFCIVGSDKSVTDTVPGRLAMASYYILRHVNEEVIRFLASIENYMSDIDEFSYNYGIALAQSGNFDKAEQVLLNVRQPAYRRDMCYMSWLCRCYIHSGKAKGAWTLYYTSTDAGSAASDTLLLLIANDCYKTAQYYYAAKAFDVLSQRSPNGTHEYWEAKRGACMGVLQQALRTEETQKHVAKVIGMLENAPPEAAHIVSMVKRALRIS